MSTEDRWASHLDPELLTGDTPGEIDGMAFDPSGPLSADEAAALDRIGAVLADESVWDGPSPDLRAGLLAQASAEAASGPGPTDAPSLEDRAAETGDVAGVVSLDQRRAARNRRIGWIGSGLVAAAAAVALVLVAVQDTDDRGQFTTFEVAGTDLTPDLAATVDIEPRVAGVAITLHIKGLGPAGDGRYYAGWLVDEAGMTDGVVTGNAVGVGSFHWRQGGIPIELWSGVDTERYPILVVTLQDEGQPPLPSDVVVMTARVDGEG